VENTFIVMGFMALVFISSMLYISQQKFKNKMLCTFIRANRQKIEQWVPLFSKHVVFDGGKHGKEHYNIDPKCIVLMWYARGINKLWPVLIPTLEFKWDTPNPLDPKTFESTWHSPEARQASWEEHEHISFARATAIAAGKASRIPAWLFPLVVIVLLLVILYITQTAISGLDKRMFDLAQQVKLLL